MCSDSCLQDILCRWYIESILIGRFLPRHTHTHNTHTHTHIHTVVCRYLLLHVHSYNILFWCTRWNREGSVAGEVSIMKFHGENTIIRESNIFSRGWYPPPNVRLPGCRVAGDLAQLMTTVSLQACVVGHCVQSLEDANTCHIQAAVCVCVCVCVCVQ